MKKIFTTIVLILTALISYSAWAQPATTCIEDVSIEQDAYEVQNPGGEAGTFIFFNFRMANLTGCPLKAYFMDQFPDGLTMAGMGLPENFKCETLVSERKLKCEINDWAGTGEIKFSIPFRVDEPLTGDGNFTNFASLTSAGDPDVMQNSSSVSIEVSSVQKAEFSDPEDQPNQVVTLTDARQASATDGEATTGGGCTMQAIRQSNLGSLRCIAWLIMPALLLRRRLITILAASEKATSYPRTRC